ncbi:MAG: O-methyltransferase family protein [uncultured bacterium]|nr:MAG: O-methyltransferase family protein [uncultured bacterium]
MNQNTWSRVDDYFAGLFVHGDEIFEQVQGNCKAAGLPAISVSSCQGMFLQILVRSCKAQRVLEIGTLGGYSGIWLGYGLEDNGELVTIEYEPEHARVASKNFELAGLSQKVTVINKDAKIALAELIAMAVKPFDLIFIDADKPGYFDYLQLSLKLARKGTLIVADNVVRKGEVANPGTVDEKVIGIRKFCQALADNNTLKTTALQTVGSKGYDGFSISIVD